MALKVKTSVDGSGFARGLEKMSEDAANFGKGLSSKIAGNFGQSVMAVVPGLTSMIAGVFSAEKIKESLSAFAGRGEEIHFGAIRLNLDEETFQRIDNVMKATGGSAGDTATAFDKLAESLVKIERGEPGTDQLRQAFADLGASTDDIAKKDLPSLFFKIASGLKEIDPSKEQLAALRTIFSKGGDNLLPAFKVGFDSPTAKSGVINKKDLETIEGYNKELLAQKNMMAGMWNHLKTGWLEDARQLMFTFNPKRWLDDMRTNPTFWFKPDNLDENARRLGELTAQNQRNEALRAQALKDREKSGALDHKAAMAIDAETAALRERNRVAPMTPEEKRLELLKQIAQMQGELDYGGGDLTKADEARLRHTIEELRGQLGELDRSKVHSTFAGVLRGNQAIGGFILGHGADDVRDHLRKSANHLQSIDAKIRPTSPPGRARQKDYH